MSHTARLLSKYIYIKKDLLRQQSQNCAFPRQTEISLQAIKKKKFGKHLQREFMDGDTTPLSFFSFICGKQKCGPFFPSWLGGAI